MHVFQKMHTGMQSVVIQREGTLRYVSSIHRIFDNAECTWHFTVKQAAVFYIFLAIWAIMWKVA
jgi:hypothetical protein